MTFTILFTVLFIVLAAFFKSVADTLADHFEVSIFKNLNPKFWNKAESWQAKRIPFTSYPLNAWHLANSGMIGSFMIIPFVYHSHYFWLLEYIVMGTLFIIAFNTFYNKILK